MRILLLTQVVPYPPDSGPKIKTYNVLRYLAQRHQVHLMSFARSAAEEAHAQALRRYCVDVTTVPLRRSRVRDVIALGRSLLNGRPFLIERDDSSQMRAAIQSILDTQTIQAVHADQLSMAQFAVNLPVPLRVLDEHNAVWTIVLRAADRERGLRRLLAMLEWRKLRRYEGRVCREFDRVTVVSPDDHVALEVAAGAQFAADMIPIAVDTEELRPVLRGSEARHVVSVATMFYPPNVEAICWFSVEIFPLVRAVLPATLFYVVGSRPPSEVVRLATSESGVVVTGYVADLDPILRQAGVLVVPVHSGSGMRVKILEAFARGIPVVSTTVGVEGISASHRRHLLVADDPAEFAHAVIRLLREPEEATRLAIAGRELVEERYDWRCALAGLDKIYGGSSTPESIPPRNRSVPQPVFNAERS